MRGRKPRPLLRQTHAMCAECGTVLRQYGQTVCEKCLCDLSRDGVVVYTRPTITTWYRVVVIPTKTFFRRMRGGKKCC